MIPLTSRIVQAQGEGGEENGYVLPLDERALVREPHLGLNAQRALVFNPHTRRADTGGQLHATRLFARVFGGGEGGEELGQAICLSARVGRDKSCGLVVAIRLLVRVMRGFLLVRLLAWQARDGHGVRDGAGSGDLRAAAVLRGRAGGRGRADGRGDAAAEGGAGGGAEQRADCEVVLCGFAPALLLLVEGLVGLLADVVFDLAEPEGEGVDVVLEELGDTVHELGEAGRFLDEVRVDEVVDPLVLLQALDLDLEQGEGELVDLALLEVLEGELHVAVVDVAPVPVVGLAARPVHVQGVFADEGHVGVERDADVVVAGDLEGGACVVGAQHGLQVLLPDEALNVLDSLLKAVNLVLVSVRPVLELLDGLLHVVLVLEEGLDVLGLDGEADFLAGIAFLDDLLLEHDLGLLVELAIPA